MTLSLAAFTMRGRGLAAKIAAAFPGSSVWAPEKLGADMPPLPDLYEWTKERFAEGGALVFIGAAGIAVRAVAPFVKDKFTDPAVVSVDEAGRFVISLLSGHVGGANMLARQIAEVTGGEAAVSTATDVNGLFAVDVWAAERGLAICGREAAKQISAALLRGEAVGFSCDFPVEGPPPEGVCGVFPAGGKTSAQDAPGPGAAEASAARAYGGEPPRPALGFCVTLDEDASPFGETLRLIPKIVTVGVGCHRGIREDEIRAAVLGALDEHHISPRAVCRIATIDVKKDEAGLLAFAEHMGWPLCFFTAEELAMVPGEFAASDFVRGTVGVDNVCERAAASFGGELRIQKQAGGGVTVAAFAAPYIVRFEEKRIWREN